MQWPQSHILGTDKMARPILCWRSDALGAGCEGTGLGFLDSPLDLFDEFADVNRAEQNQFESAPAQEFSRDQIAAGNYPNGNLAGLLRKFEDFCFWVIARGEIRNNQTRQDLAETFQSLACSEAGLRVNALFDQLCANQGARLPFLSD
jgi:hypothetical protein